MVKIYETVSFYAEIPVIEDVKVQQLQNKRKKDLLSSYRKKFTTNRME